MRFLIFRDRTFDPLTVSPWVAMSLMQKAIRRGRERLALRAAATLLDGSPERLWRRLGCIAFWDIGIADIDAVAMPPKSSS
jgi:replication-associated recombination protein RarA